MKRYDLVITEHSHRFEPKTWTLTDHAHLIEVCDAASRKDYTGGYDVDQFLEWLGSDLRALTVEKGE